MEETFLTFHRVLSFAGIPLFASKNWTSKSWLLLQTFNFIISLICFTFTTAFVASNISDLPIFIQSACIWTTGVIMTISFGICLFFRRKFRGFLCEMAFKDRVLEMPFIEYVLQQERGSKLMELKTMVVESQANLLKYSRVLLMMYTFSAWFNATLYLCNPIYLMSVREDEELRLVPFDMWFPWSLQDMKVYVASFIFNAYCGYLCCVAYPGFQSTIILLVGQVVRQIRLINFILLHLDELAMEMCGERNEEWRNRYTAVLSQCAHHYIVLKKFSNRLNVICQPFYLALILIAMMLMCMCSVKIAVSDKLALDTMKYYYQELSIILIVFMFCLLGQKVDNECESLENAVTEKWYIFDENHKKNILIFHVALSQRMPIFIFGTIRLYLPTFTWYIKTGMSFFTLLMSFLEEEQ